MIKFYATYDTQNDTWNAMNNDSGECLFYGSAEQLDEWADANNDKYEEVL